VYSEKMTGLILHNNDINIGIDRALRESIAQVSVACPVYYVSNSTPNNKLLKLYLHVLLRRKKNQEQKIVQMVAKNEQLFGNSNSKAKNVSRNANTVHMM
jgi:hypothetical protein